MLNVHRIKMNFKRIEVQQSEKKNSTEGSTQYQLLVMNFKVKDKYSRFKIGSEIILTHPF